VLRGTTASPVEKVAAGVSPRNPLAGHPGPQRQKTGPALEQSLAGGGQMGSNFADALTMPAPQPARRGSFDDRGFRSRMSPAQSSRHVLFVRHVPEAGIRGLYVSTNSETAAARSWCSLRVIHAAILPLKPARWQLRAEQ